MWTPAFCLILGVAIGAVIAIPAALLAERCTARHSPAFDRVLAYLLLNARDRGTWIGACRLAGIAGLASDPAHWELYAGLGAGLGELARIAMTPPGAPL